MEQRKIKVVIVRPMAAVGISISKCSIEKYIELSNTCKYNCGCYQTFIGGQVNFKLIPFSDSTKKKICDWCALQNKRLIVHCPLHLNLAKSDTDNLTHITNSKDCLKSHLLALQDIPSRMVLHPGKHLELSKSEGITNISTHLNELYSSLDSNLKPILRENLCLENAAGQGTELGVGEEEMRKIIEQLDFTTGICLDTQHSYASGWCSFENENCVDKWLCGNGESLELEKFVKVIHLNDSSKTFGSRVDRHSSFKEGLIWNSRESRKSLRYLLEECEIRNIDVVLETKNQHEDLEIIHNLERKN